MSGTLSEGSIVKALATSAAKRITRHVITALQKAPTGWGAESVLKSVWDQVCVQVQHEESAAWDVYDETVRTLVANQIKQLPKHEQEALWLQTDEGLEWAWEDQADGGFHPALITDIMHYVVNKHVYAEADRWSNARIRTYIERASMTD